MKNVIIRCTILISVITILSWTTGCKSLNMESLVKVGKQGFAAAMLTDDQMAEMAKKGIAEMDAKNRLSPPDSVYSMRLAKIARNFTEVNGRTLDFRVYDQNVINAFAMPDGSVRVYSGLMDIMTDDELLFVIGHEIGHVAKGHSRKRFQLAYSTSALRGLVNDQGGMYEQVASSKFGDFMEKIVQSQYSQHNELESDEYGLATVQNNNRPKTAAITALQKLGSLSKEKAGIFQQLISSHPQPGKRAQRIKDGK